MRRLVLPIVILAVGVVSAAAQAPVPVPRPFPGAPTPPATSGPAPATAAPAPATTAIAGSPQPANSPVIAPEPAAQPSPDLPGVPAPYPTAEYLESFDAGSQQQYVLYGTDAPFAEVVTYYRTLLKTGGREIYRTPGVYQFDLGRFDDNRMAFPPSIVVKDYAGGTSPGYLHVSGTEEKRFRTIIQIVPPPPATAR